MNQKQQLENDIKELETKLNEMKATVAAMPPEAPARWVPGDGERFFVLIGDYPNISGVTWGGGKSDHYRLSLGNVHRTKEDAENYRLRLESFVPALGPETPSDEVLRDGWLADYDGTTDAVNDTSYMNVVRQSYQDGTWQPTREAAKAWLAKYGKVRGYTV